MKLRFNRLTGKILSDTILTAEPVVPCSECAVTFAAYDVLVRRQFGEFSDSGTPNVCGADECNAFTDGLTQHRIFQTESDPCEYFGSFPSGTCTFTLQLNLLVGNTARLTWRRVGSPDLLAEWDYIFPNFDCSDLTDRNPTIYGAAGTGCTQPNGILQNISAGATGVAGAVALSASIPSPPSEIDDDFS